MLSDLLIETPEMTKIFESINHQDLPLFSQVGIQSPVSCNIFTSLSDIDALNLTREATYSLVQSNLELILVLTFFRWLIFHLLFRTFDSLEDSHVV